MSYYTKAQVATKITAIETAISAVLTGQTYSMDTGQGRISYTRASLGELQKQLDYWVAKWEELDDDRGAIASYEYKRNWR